MEMQGWCITRLQPPPGLLPREGVLRGAGLGISADARQLADRLLEQARAEAAALLAQAQSDAERLQQEAEQSVLARAQPLFTALDQAQATLLDRAEDMVIELTLAAVQQVLAELTPREKLEAALRRLRQEAPPRLVEPVLRLHPDDREQLSAQEDALEWEVQCDASLSPGRCRLEAASGEWCVDFDAAVSAVIKALADCKSRA